MNHEGADSNSDSNLEIYESVASIAREAKTRHAHGWVNASEQAAVAMVAARVRGKRILDIGIGAGRTTELLTLLSDDYVGIDYARSRVRVCQQQFPTLDLRTMDVRDLSSFDDGSFDLVSFSFNGIDYINHSQRATALAGIHRVLAPGGLFVFSTLNRNGSSFDERPWQLHRPGEPFRITPHKALRLAGLTVTDPGRVWRRFRNWGRTRRLCTDGPQWGTRPLAALDFALVQHFVTLRGLREELAGASLEILRIFESEYERYSWPPPEIDEAADRSRAAGFQVVALRTD